MASSFILGHQIVINIMIPYYNFTETQYEERTFFWLIENYIGKQSVLELPG